jgi:hypothetical protein
MVELVVTVDAAMQATYKVEGDGPLALTCTTLYFNQLSALKKEPLAALKQHGCFHHVNCMKMRPDIQAIDLLVSFPFMSSEIPALKEKFLLYIAAAEAR